MKSAGSGSFVRHVNKTLVLAGILVALILVNIIFIVLIRNQIATVLLLRAEQNQLANDRRIISTSEDISARYRDQIAAISAVFPNEVNFPRFIEYLESTLRLHTDSYKIKFNSFSPVAEQDKLILLLTLSLNSDYNRLAQILTELEKAPYMTHVTGIHAKSGGGFTGAGEYTVAMKVYVQNPFSQR